MDSGELIITQKQEVKAKYRKRIYIWQNNNIDNSINIIITLFKMIKPKMLTSNIY